MCFNLSWTLGMSGIMHSGILLLTCFFIQRLLLTFYSCYVFTFLAFVKLVLEHFLHLRSRLRQVVEPEGSVHSKTEVKHSLKLRQGQQPNNNIIYTAISRALKSCYTRYQNKTRQPRRHTVQMYASAIVG